MATWIKICGNTNIEDALAAVHAGADALGFLFADSRRRVRSQDVKDIVSELPSSIETYGVFVNEPVEEVIGAAHDLGLTGVQLHGDETPEYMQQIAKAAGAKRVKIIKSISAETAHSGRLPCFAGVDQSVDAFIVDSGNVTMRGGTGQVFDWLRASDFVMTLQQKAKVIIAGGLNPENVAAAVCLFRPWGVDVVTGVEKQYGKKDHDKLRAFIAAVRASDPQPFTRNP